VRETGIRRSAEGKASRAEPFEAAAKAVSRWRSLLALGTLQLPPKANSPLTE
jgi:hypothetical protein